LLLDEPTTAQDYKGRHDIVKIAQSLNRKGETIIMVTHDMELVAEYADRTIVLGTGEVLMDGPTAEVFCERDRLAETFLKPPQITQFAQSLSQFGVPPSVIHVDDMVKLLNTGGAN
jgi:energy-coupling factor transport system ATP-binding protein